MGLECHEGGRWVEVGDGKPLFNFKQKFREIIHMSGTEDTLVNKTDEQPLPSCCLQTDLCFREITLTAAWRRECREARMGAEGIQSGLG